MGMELANTRTLYVGFSKSCYALPIPQKQRRRHPRTRFRLCIPEVQAVLLLGQEEEAEVSCCCRGRCGGCHRRAFESYGADADFPEAVGPVRERDPVPGVIVNCIRYYERRIVRLGDRLNKKQWHVFAYVLFILAIAFSWADSWSALYANESMDSLRFSLEYRLRCILTRFALAC